MGCEVTQVDPYVLPLTPGLSRKGRGSARHYRSASLPVLTALLVVVYGCNGVLIPSLFVLAMEGHPSLAGSAYALIGTMNFAGGALIIAAAAPFADGRPLPMVVGVVCCTMLACVLGIVDAKRDRSPANLVDGPLPR